MGEVGESGQRVLDAVVAEFEASCADRLDMRCHHVRVPGGIVEFCGTDTDRNCWNAAYVTDGRAVLPLVVGHHDRVAHAYQRLDRADTPFWDAAQFPPPIVRVDGNRFYFAPARGRLLLGQVRLERRAVLLAAIGDDQIAVIHVAGRVRSVLHVGAPHSFRELDVDLQLRLQRRTGQGSARSDPLDPVRPAATILAHHRRIVHGITVDLGPGPSISEIVTACFEDLADRARALKASNGKPLRGKRWIRHVTRVLCKLALLGVGDLVGRIGEIITAIQEHDSAFTITPEAMSDVLGRLQLLGTCVVDPRDDGDRIWRLNLAGLCDPCSTIHRRLCRETRTRRAPAVPVETARGEDLATSDSHARAAEAVAASGDRPPGAAPPPTSTVDPTVGLDTLSPPQAATAATMAATPDADNPAAATPTADAASTVEKTSPAPPTAAADAPADDGQTHDRDDLAAAVRELLELPPAAGRTLRLAARVHRESRAAARRSEDPGVGDGPSPRPDPPDPARVLGKPPQSARRRLHVSPDHTFGLPRLAVVAHAVRSPPGELQPHPKNSSLRPRPGGRGPRRARGPPEDQP